MRNQIFLFPKAHLGKRFLALLIDDVISFTSPIIVGGLIAVLVGCFILPALLFLYLILIPFAFLINDSSMLYNNSSGDEINKFVILTLWIFGLIVLFLLFRLFKTKKNQIIIFIKKLLNPKIYIPALLLLIPFLYYFIKDWFNNGQSFGKKIMGLMVIHVETNQPCTMGGSFLRCFILLLLSLPFGAGIFVESLYAMIQNEGRRLGDFAAKTQVISISDYKK